MAWNVIPMVRLYFHFTWHNLHGWILFNHAQLGGWDISAHNYAIHVQGWLLPPQKRAPLRLWEHVCLILWLSHTCVCYNNRPDQGWCKYCCSLEKELTNSLEAKERWADETSWEDISFKQVDPYFESRTSTSLAELAESRKRKHALVCVPATASILHL